MKRLIPLMFCALCAAPVVLAAPQPVGDAASPLPAPPAIAQQDVTEMSLQRQQGFEFPGVYPINYTFTFYSNGRATALIFIDGESKDKNYTGTIDKEEFRRIAELVGKSKYFELNSAPLIVDAARVITSVVKDGKRKKVNNIAHGSNADLWLIETLLRGLATDVRWSEVPPPKRSKTQPQQER